MARLSEDVIGCENTGLIPFVDAFAGYKSFVRLDEWIRGPSTLCSSLAIETENFEVLGFRGRH